MVFQGRSSEVNVPFNATALKAVVIREDGSSMPPPWHFRAAGDKPISVEARGQPITDA